MGTPLLDFKEEKWQRGGHIIRINITEIRSGKWRNWTGVITSGNISVGGSLAGGSEPQGNLSKAWEFLILKPLAKKAAPKVCNPSNGKEATAEISRKCRVFQAFQCSGFQRVPVCEKQLVKTSQTFS